MANIRASVAQATAVVDYDCFKDEPQNRQPFARIITGVGVVGSAAAGDFIIELMVGGVSHGKFENVATGTAFVEGTIKKTDIYVGANAQVQAIVRDAANTNPVVCYCEFGQPAKTSSRRWSSRRSTNRYSTKSRSNRSAGGMY